MERKHPFYAWLEQSRWSANALARELGVSAITLHRAACFIRPIPDRTYRPHRLPARVADELEELSDGMWIPEEWGHDGPESRAGLKGIRARRKAARQAAAARRARQLDPDFEL